MKYKSYKPIQQVRDAQPIRTTCFHPSGETYVVGTNSKALKICKYPSAERIRELIGEDGNMDGLIAEPEISFTCLHIHCASVYCSSFNQSGDLLATGSNDQIVHIIKYDHESHAPVGNEYKLSLHTGTVRDVCFLPSTAPSTSSRLLSAGGGEFEINLTDCGAMKPVQSFRGHEATVMSLHSSPNSDNIFISGSLDGTVKIWDTRCREPVSSKSLNPAAVGAVRLDPTGRLLVSGHLNGFCVLYDTRAEQIIQSFRAHEDQIRTVSFSPESYYLLSGSYDKKARLTDLQGDLTKPLLSVELFEQNDKIVQAAWHPFDYNFVTTCADGSATLWTMPDFDEWRRESTGERAEI